jgi:hypothetical protein
MQFCKAHQAARRRPQPLLLELHHLVDETLALFPDAVALRHAHLVKVQQAVSLLFMPILRIFCRHLDAGASTLPRGRPAVAPSQGSCSCADGPSPVLTSMHIQSACRLLVIHIFWPVIT